MDAKAVLRQTVDFCHGVIMSYVADLTDRDLFVRSVPEANHIAWQLGHLIASDQWFLCGLGAQPPALPAGFAERYTKETAHFDDPARFHTHAEYMRLIEQCRSAALAAIEATPVAALERRTPDEWQAFAPNVAGALAMLGTHWLMHAGQFVPIRRKLGKAALY